MKAIVSYGNGVNTESKAPSNHACVLIVHNVVKLIMMFTGEHFTIL